jgi:hypothetical protein
MIPEVLCEVVLDNEQEIGWHRTTEGHIWIVIIILKGKFLRMQNAAFVMSHRKERKAPKWFTVDNKNKLCVRYKNAKEEAKFN